ncbi:MAG: serine protease [Acidimicrobiales bacterium]
MPKLRFIGLATVLLLLYGSWASSMSAAGAAVPEEATSSRAQPATTLGPDTPVASDGSSVASPISSAEVSSAGVDGHQGTGVAGDPTVAQPDGKTDPGYNGQESVIGTDDRTQVTATTSFPNSAIVRITFSAGSCTGWMIGQNTVATAGHCVAQGGVGFYDVSTYTIAPGQNGSSQPFGTCGATRLFSVSGWLDSNNEEYDYGAIKLKCNIGNNTGWFGFFWQSASLTGSEATVTGYPGDKPFGTSWTHTLSIAVTEDRQLFYQIDTAGGQSGSPVWKPNQPNLCSGGCAMAIHAYGLHGAAPHGTNNHGSRITEARFNNLISWRDAPK